MEEWSRRAATQETIIRQYSDMVYRLAYAQVRTRSDADDIFQEVFLRYVKANPEFQSPEHQKAWFIRVTLNCAKSHLGSAWRRVLPLEEREPIPPDQSPEDTQLTEALDQLPPLYQAVVHLYYYEEYSTKEIAKLLHRRESTVRTQLTRAREKLSHLLKGVSDGKRRIPGDV